jgi:hypothetical protein
MYLATFWAIFYKLNLVTLNATVTFPLTSKKENKYLRMRDTTMYKYCRT